MNDPHTLSATTFKATCLEVMDRVARGELERVVITKRGRVVAVLVPPSAAEAGAAPLHGLLRGSVHGSEAVDLTAPVLDEAFGAAEGLLHG
jgi:prevent-host-death family protein